MPRKRNLREVSAAPVQVRLPGGRANLEHLQVLMLARQPSRQGYFQRPRLPLNEKASHPEGLFALCPEGVPFWHLPLFVLYPKILTQHMTFS